MTPPTHQLYCIVLIKVQICNMIGGVMTPPYKMFIWRTFNV